MEKTLTDGLLCEMQRVQGLIKEYEELPNGAGNLRAIIISWSIERAEQAIISGDFVDILEQYHSLKNFTS